MKRRLLNVAAAASLLLCVTVCVFWLRSYCLSDQLRWRRVDGQRSVLSANGHVVLGLWLADHANLQADWYGLKYTRDTMSGPFNYMLLMNGEPGDIDFSWEWGGFAWYEKRN